MSRHEIQITPESQLRALDFIEPTVTAWVEARDGITDVLAMTHLERLATWTFTDPDGPMALLVLTKLLGASINAAADETGGDADATTRYAFEGLRAHLQAEADEAG
jgi:hypothetical protein